MPNFAFVQQTGCDSNPSQTFASPNTAGNCIIAIAFQAGGDPSIMPTDTQGNTYVQIAFTHSANNNRYYAAKHIAGGSANTVTCLGSSIYAAEYSSVDPNYFVCPGHMASGSGDFAQGTITSLDSGNFPGPFGADWVSPREVMVLFCAWVIDIGASGAPYIIQTGTKRLEADLPLGSGWPGFILAADDNVANIAVAYNNDIEYTGFGGPVQGIEQTMCIFLNLSSQCVGVDELSVECGSPPSGMAGTAYDHLFPSNDGVQPYTYSIVSGELPPGLTIDPVTGVVSGIPTLAGTYPFEVGVTDSEVPPVVASPVSCSITIAPSMVNVTIPMYMEFRGVKRTVCN